MLTEFNDMKKLKLYIKAMFSHCLKCRINTESKNPNVVRTKNGEILLLSKYAVCDNKSRNLLKSRKLEDY